MTRLPSLTLVLLTLARSAGAEWTVAAFLGGAHTTSDRLVLKQRGRTHLTFDPVRYETRALNSPPYYGYRVTYYFDRTSTWGIEGELIHLKLFARTDQEVASAGTLDGRPVSGRLVLDQIVSQFAMSHGLNFALVNVVFRTPSHRQDDRVRRVLLFGRVGAGPTIPHVEANVLGARSEGYRPGRLGLQIAGGIEVQVMTHVAIAAEYKLTRTRQRVDVFAGEIMVPVLTHHGVAGLVYRF